MNLELKILIFITFLTIGIFFLQNAFLGGYMGHGAYQLHEEIGSPKTAVYEWNLSKKPPFKYRILFSGIVKGSWEVLPDSLDKNASFRWVYQFWSLVFFLSAALSWYKLLRVMHFSPYWSLAGYAFFAISPAFFLAYSLPVHSREDLLAYTLLNLGLILLIKKRVGWFVLVTVAGALCRETLLILPLVFLIFFRQYSFLGRVLVFAIPVLVWLAVRVIGYQPGYIPWEGFLWNLYNPAQVIGFSWLTFSFLWPLLALGIWRRKVLGATSEFDLTLIYQSSMLAVPLIFVTTYIGGIFNEIRLLFLMYPWVVTIALHTFYKILKEDRGMHSVHLVMKWYVLAVGVVVGAGYLLFHNYLEQNINQSQYSIRFDVWTAVTFISVAIFMVFIPLYWKIFTCFRSLNFDQNKGVS